VSAVDNIYVSFDEARAESARRGSDAGLRSRVEAELGEHFMPAFRDLPRGLYPRQLISPDNGFTFFFQGARYVGTEPLVLEFHDDIFTTLNEEKKSLGRLRITQADGTRATIDIMDFHAAEKMKLGDVIIKTGERLVDFHSRLLRQFGYRVDVIDNSAWCRGFGRAAEYYYPLLCHFVAHGVLFETFDTEDEKEDAFTRGIILPAMERVEQTFGLKPLVVRLYPAEQNDDEDFYWWSYPPAINDYLIKFAEENNLPWRKWKPKK
jgi:hypothetical protein